MKTQLYKAEVNTPFGKFLYFAETTTQDAAVDIYSLVHSDLRIQYGNFTVSQPVKTNDIESAAPIKMAIANNKQWGWAKRISK